MHQGSKFFSSDHDPDDVLLRHKAEVTAVTGVKDIVSAKEIPIVFEAYILSEFCHQERPVLDCQLPA